MKAVPKSKIREVVGSIVFEQADQYGFTAEEIKEHMVKTLEACYDSKTMFAYVDDVENTSCCLVCGHHFSMMFPGTHITAYMVWVKPELRNTKSGFQMIKDMLVELNAFGAMFDAENISISSWLYKSLGPNSGKLWTRLGFEPQELVLTKKVEY